jgi:hypothetical protein
MRQDRIDRQLGQGLGSKIPVEQQIRFAPLPRR